MVAGSLCPHSDIDLMFLYSKSLGGKTQEALKETMTREILYPLWDSGLKVGHASRDLKEAIAESQSDIRNKNSMLDARFICGDRKMSERFMQKFLKHCRNHEPEKYLEELHAHQKERDWKSKALFIFKPRM